MFESDHKGLLYEQNHCAMYKTCTETRLSDTFEHFEKSSKNQNGATFFQISQIFWKVLFPKILKQLCHFLRSNVRLIDAVKCFTLLQKRHVLWLFYGI